MNQELALHTLEISSTEGKGEVDGTIKGVKFKQSGGTYYDDTFGKRIQLRRQDIEKLGAPGQTHDVRIVNDTNPSNPRQGVYHVAIIESYLALEGDVPMAQRIEKEFADPVEIDPQTGTAIVLDIELPSYEPTALTPQKEKFSFFTLDRLTLKTLEKIAMAVSFRQACLLEGETSTSKTSSIEYLASLVGASVFRINLNGQTDTSELIGKYTPNDGRLAQDYNELLARPHLLSSVSRNILEQARSVGRPLSLFESKKIAQLEGITGADWCWHNGMIPEAMQKGYWVILDEVNLAEAQILERLNSVLEKFPSLTLSEYDGTTIGSRENPVHEQFRIFGTMNPAEYHDRIPMTPAFKDRWASRKICENPTEKEYEAMMNLMVYGEHPKCQFRGVKYQGAQQESLLPTLSSLTNIRTLISKIALLQVSLEGLARSRDIGRGRKEPYIFTRRSLIEFMNFLESASFTVRRNGERKTVSITTDPQHIILRAIEYFFLDKVSGDEDRKKVMDQLTMLGICQSNWKLPEIKVQVTAKE